MAEKCLTLTVDEAAKLLGIGRSLAYRQVREGHLPARRIGDRWLIPRWALIEFLKSGKIAVLEEDEEVSLTL